MLFNFSWKRLWAVMLKEFINMKHDRLTMSLIIFIPLIQVILFGYAINNNPKHLATAVINNDNSIYTRNVLTALQNTEYFNITGKTQNEQTANKLLAKGKIQFIIQFPANFTERLVRDEKPKILVEADSSFPTTTVNALDAVRILNQQALNKKYTGTLSKLQIHENPIMFVIHPKYNPNRNTAYYIVPGLLGVVLMMTMIVITSLNVTRERENGTMETLLVMPLNPLEVILGMLIPYILVGYIQLILMLLIAYYLFAVPIEGSLWLLIIASLPFIITNLAIGLFFSTIAKNQLQALQLSFFFFLPSLLLSGFMFPFQGMPSWAQALGNIFPLTNYLLITRGILLKGNTFTDIFVNIESIIIFFFIIIIITVKRYRRTLI